MLNLLYYKDIVCIVYFCTQNSILPRYFDQKKKNLYKKACVLISFCYNIVKGFRLPCFRSLIISYSM